MNILFVILISFLPVIFPLFRIFDEISFNLKDYRDTLTIYNNYTRHGDLTIYKNTLVLAPRIKDTYGLIYTNHEILSNRIEIHANFEISPEKGFGSAFAIWFFKDNLEFLKDAKRNVSYLGFKVRILVNKQDFNGIGVFFITKPKFHTEHFTSIFIKKNDGSVKRSNFGMKRLNRFNSCHIPLKQLQYMTIQFTPQFYLKFKDQINIIQNACIFDLGGYLLEPPYRIGISTFNGEMMGEEYLDNITIEKFMVINDDMWNSKESFIKINNNGLKKLERDYILNYSSQDLIEKINSSNIRNFITNLTSTEKNDKIEVLEENRENNIIPESLDKSLVELLTEFNNFLEKKISFLIEAKCEYDNNINSKIQLNNEIFKDLKGELENNSNNEFYTVSHRLTENLIKLKELINGFKDKNNEEEINKKRTFLKNVIRQKMIFYSTKLKSVIFPNSLIEKIIFTNLYGIEKYALDDKSFENGTLDNTISKEKLVFVMFVLIIVLTLITMISPLLKRKIRKNLKKEYLKEMGNCYESQINPIDLLQNELEISEFLRQEKYLIKKIISRSFKKNQELIDSTNVPKNFKAIPKLRAILEKLDGNFSEVVFYDIIIHLEGRFKKEKYKNFEEVRKRFKLFYNNNFFNTEYNSLMLNSEEFNEFLDKEKVIKLRRKTTLIK